MAWRKGNSQLGRVARGAAAAMLTASALILATAPADARGHHHRRHYAHAGHFGVPSSPAFSAIVVDANSGRAVYAVDENGLRHPASITKVMTLYLLFEQLDKGAITLQSRIPISEHAAAQEPSKLGLEPGETISVDDAIKAVVTRSANDIAVAIAEAIGHDESSFAEMMTRKAHALGMTNTTYRNASGLPNDQQITTARDLTVLARSLEDRFPRYFKYFSTEEFEYDGQTIGNHNHLLGRVDGVDGIKTGYTRASGFNLLTSVHRDGRSLIAVVMGGRSAAARDRVMENLIDDHLAQCSTVRTATQVADASSEDEDAAAPAQQPAETARPRPIAVAAKVPTHLQAAHAPQSRTAKETIPTTTATTGRPSGSPRSRPRSASTPQTPPRCRRSRSPSAPARRFASPMRPRQPPCAAGQRVPTPRSSRIRRQACRPRSGRRTRPRPKPPSPPVRRTIPTIPTTTAGGGQGLEDPDRRDRQRRQGDGASRQGALARSFGPRRGEAGDRENAQGRRSLLPRAVRRARLGFRGIPPVVRSSAAAFPVSPPVTDAPDPRRPSERPTLAAASEHPWPD